MTSVERRDSTPVAAPNFGRLGQATAVEASRAIAQVQMAVTIAQQVPRDEDKAVARMRRSCSSMAVAEKAFYEMPRGNSTVSGPSVHLARELVRCWGNMDYGVAELSRDDIHGQSEMIAFAWDMEDNTRSSETFIVPHKRAGAGAKLLTDTSAIYENNANNGARRVRQAVFALLPPWFRAEAEALCRDTLNKASGKPLSERIDDAIERYAALDITVDQLERKTGVKRAKWTANHVTNLGILYASLTRNEITREDAFPQERVSAADITNPA